MAAGRASIVHELTRHDLVASSTAPAGCTTIRLPGPRTREAHLRLPELLASGPEAGLARAEELFSGLCAEDLDDERCWIALFRIHERTGSAAVLERAVRRYRNAGVELGTTEISDIDKVPLPLNLERIVNDIRRRIDGGVREPTTGGD